MRHPIAILLATAFFLAECNDAAVVAIAVPSRPIGNTTAAPRGTVETFAIDQIFLGDSSRDGSQITSSEWKAFGYDLDGLITDKSSTNVCQLAEFAPSFYQIDGNGGIDNATGATLVPILQAAASLATPSATATTLIHSGTWTVQIQTDGLSPGAANVVGIGMQVFVSGQYDDGAPSFDSATDWPVLTSSLANGLNIADGALVNFEDAYVTSDGTFVSGVRSDQAIAIPVAFPTRANSPSGGAPATLTLRVHRAVVTFTRNAADPTRLVNGTIAGVLDVQEISDAAALCARRMDTAFCGATFDGLAEQISQAPDILRDGTNAPGPTCDAISIGIGFTARQIANPTKVAEAPPPTPDPCGEGSFDGGTARCRCGRLSRRWR